MFALAGDEGFDQFVADFQAFKLDDADESFAVFPDLALAEF